MERSLKSIRTKPVAGERITGRIISKHRKRAGRETTAAPAKQPGSR